ncbi:MAG: macro domain-containing protein [Chloroflexi bacterium]|nr:macro domain-containing protein [Chloroflexota bacterium]
MMRERIYPSGRCFQITQGDLTQQDVDAIVNAANAQLQHGGGVAGIIVRRGGQAIQAESDRWVREHGRVSHAEPAYTSGGNLPCRYVIHAVGPVWGEGDEDAKLAAAVAGSLRLADALRLESIALPAISTGIFGFPKARAAQIIFAAVEEYFIANPHSGLSLVRLVLYDQPTVEAFLQMWDSCVH